MSIYHSNEPVSLGRALRAWIDQNGLRQRVDEARAVETWAHLAGPAILRVTDSVSVRNGVLTVRLTSAMWRHHLHQQREEWRQKLNAALGREVIDEVVFR